MVCRLTTTPSEVDEIKAVLAEMRREWMKRVTSPHMATFLAEPASR